MSVVFWKELADHFSSRRFMILLALIVLIGLWAAYASGQAIRQDTENTPTQYVFLFLLTSGTGTVFSLATFLGFFGPLVGITLGFDSISGEYARGTLSRVLSQPIYRDSLINGKFFAGLATVAILWGSILLLVIGLGITLLGFPPNAEELWRMLIFTAVGIFYVGFWLALAYAFFAAVSENRHRGARFHGGLALHDAVRRHRQPRHCRNRRSRSVDAGSAGAESRCREYRQPNFAEYAFF